MLTIMYAVRQPETALLAVRAASQSNSFGSICESMRAASFNAAERLAAAERACTDAGERLTTKRREVLEVVQGSDAPISAYDILARLSSDARMVKPPTVYRALEFLERMGLVHKIDSIRAYVGCDVHDHQHQAAFLVCTSCKRSVEVEAPASDTALSSAATQAGFAVSQIIQEVHGVCGQCTGAPEALGA